MKSKRIAVIGMQWGDEGKGKIVDYLAEGCDISARFNGGNNAGHTVETSEFGRKKVHLLPSSSFREGMVSVLGNGMVADVDVLRREICEVKKTNPGLKLLIDERIHVISQEHKERDAKEESGRAVQIGTTKSGNGPAYSDKAARKGVRLCDVAGKNEVIGPYLGDASQFLNQQADIGKNIIFAGAHGVLLDIDHGDYPYCTSSNCIPAAIGTGAGFDPRKLTNVVGVMKAYSTRVGSGPFHTEFDEPTAKLVREVGREYGTTTGRPRRVGALDLVMLKYVARLCNFDSLAITLVDVLSCLDEIKVCIGYNMADGVFTDTPDSIYRRHDEVKSLLYATFPGWKGIDISSCRKESELPLNLRFFIHSIAANLNVPVRYLSVGPRRDQIIELG